MNSYTVSQLYAPLGGLVIYIVGVLALIVGSISSLYAIRTVRITRFTSRLMRYLTMKGCATYSELVAGLNLNKDQERTLIKVLNMLITQGRICVVEKDGEVIYSPKKEELA